MKIIEAMKKLTDLAVKAEDLRAKVGAHCANLNIETPLYADPKSQRRCAPLSASSTRAQKNGMAYSDA